MTCKFIFITNFSVQFGSFKTYFIDMLVHFCVGKDFLPYYPPLLSTDCLLVGIQRCSRALVVQSFAHLYTQLEVYFSCLYLHHHSVDHQLAEVSF